MELNKFNNQLVFKGSNCLRTRLILSVLTGRSIRIEDIRRNSKTKEKGLNSSEKNLLELINKITNGSEIEISSDGTSLEFKPGMLIGGKINHDCGLERSISYYLEVLMSFAPFCKEKVQANLNGVTNDNLDYSVDSYKLTTIPLMIKYLNIYDTEEIELKIISRGFKPNGGGEVFFKCPLRKTLKPVQFVVSGKIKKIRGVAYSARVSPEISNRLIKECKQYLLKFVPDVYINVDHLKGMHSGKSAGFGLCLVAETVNEVGYVGECLSNPKGSDKGPSLPEDIAKQATFNLLEEIYRGGCVSSINQSLALLYMSLGHNDISKLQLGPLNPHSIQLLRHMETFMKITFRLEQDAKVKSDIEQEFKKGSQKIMATCLGIGYQNLSKNVI